MTKITIQGTAPKYDSEVLKQRQSARHNQYHLTSESCTVARGEIAFEFLTKVIELSAQGYELSNKYPIITTPLSYSAHLHKPNAIVMADIEALDAQVKIDYIADLEREREEYRVKLTAQLLQAAESKEKKKEEERQAKLMKEIEKEVSDTFAELVIPD